MKTQSPYLGSQIARRGEQFLLSQSEVVMGMQRTLFDVANNSPLWLLALQSLMEKSMV